MTLPLVLNKGIYENIIVIEISKINKINYESHKSAHQANKIGIEICSCVF